ncbi:MAG: DUF2147 domain-containing protein [Bacteroidota bacterium]
MKKEMRNRLVLVVGLVSCGFQLSAQTVFGKWKTIDDTSGEAKAIVEVYQKDNTLNAKILQILEEGREDAVCIKCKGDLKDKPVKGMHIIKDFKPNGTNEYKGTYLLDPENGTTYRGKLWLDEDNTNRLKVRGYVAFLFRTQTWHRVN